MSALYLDTNVFAHAAGEGVGEQLMRPRLGDRRATFTKLATPVPLQVVARELAVTIAIQ